MFHVVSDSTTVDASTVRPEVVECHNRQTHRQGLDSGMDFDIFELNTIYFNIK